ncbi:hypothetical protein BU24DRAFT_428259 [Aaosphaeria arxii CBS 175.79]|uniref:Uncharacterized protein n=1 Tax=Aaosphaeria arxii CBS 175.79 TaxID=1450172 RepID=A0A6A5XBS5_9PLEO|nr:uncharacterized protein BU24DRAFT_428259 [Aaosphaeria arxii CBS 175.79]KAF2010257.1 hypothetical protein BU24DRAFT_428259 [Aaosphaeria arxii CBS 175.79]
MSSSSQAPQPHETHDDPGEQELENGAKEDVVALAGQMEMLETDGSTEKKNDPRKRDSEPSKVKTGPSVDEGQSRAAVEETAPVLDRPVDPNVGRGKDLKLVTDTSRDISATSTTTTTVEAQPLDASPPPIVDDTSKSAGKAPIRSPSPPPPPPKDDKFLASDNNTPSRANSPVSQGKSSGRNSEDAAASSYAAQYDAGESAVDDSRSEIQSIMEQFEDGHGGPGADEIMSPRLEIAGPLLESPVVHPPRRSSLANLEKPLPTPTDATSSEQVAHSPPPRTSSLYRVGTNTSLSEPMSPSAHAPQYKPNHPVPDPEPDLPFDFHRFLEQLRHKSADPVAKFLRSFLLEFGKKQWMVHEQVKIISDFLEFISKKMAQCEVWRTVSDAEFDNAREGMEKLVMNRLYSQTFSPAIPPPEPVHHKGRRRGGEPLGLGRRGQHQEDVERDEVLAQRVRIYKWVKEDHLDIQPVGDKGKKFLVLAQQELLKIKSYRAPRDKVICILNCCKVIFGYLRTSSSDQSADAFVPLLIYTVLQANPDHLVSNVQYILRFRNQDKLGGEAGYYISSLMGAIQFIEGLDKTSLTVSDEEFEKNVEAAVSAIAEKHSELESDHLTPDDPNSTNLRPQNQYGATHGHRRMPSPHLHLSEKSALSRPEVTQRNSLDAERAGPRRSTSVRNTTADVEQPEEENAAVAGLLRTIQRPLSTIGRIFSDNDTTPQSSSGPVGTPRLSPNPPGPQPRRSSDYPANTPQEYNEKEVRRRSIEEQRHRERLSAEDAAARQASAEAEEARKIQRQEHRVVVETLAGMFPALDREVIDDVVRLKEGRVGLAVDACLALSNP